MNYLIAFPGCSFFTLLRSNECTASRRRAVNPLVTSRFNAGYISVSSKLPEHKCNSDTAISRWSRRRPTASARLPSRWRHSGSKAKVERDLFRSRPLLTFVRPYFDPSSHARWPVCCLCFSVFRNIPDIVSLLYLPLFASFSLSLSLLCNDRPSPPGTS